MSDNSASPRNRVPPSCLTVSDTGLIRAQNADREEAWLLEGTRFVLIRETPAQMNVITW